MRNKESIHQVCEELERCWNTYPNLKLGQLLIDAVGSMNLFHINDEELVKVLKDFASQE